MNDQTEQFIHWLRGRPTDAEILWHSSAVSAEVQWAGGWVDIGVEAFRPKSIVSCGITFVPPHHSHLLPDSSHFILERDLAVHAVYSPISWFTTEVPLKTEEILTGEQETLLEQALAADPECRRGVRGGWSVEQLGKGLYAWTEQYVGRPDLCWVWNQSWEFPQRLQAFLMGLNSGAEPTYRIDEGLVVSDQAFSTLLDLGPAWSRPKHQARLIQPVASQDPFDL
jgi:hypothetical protein